MKFSAKRKGPELGRGWMIFILLAFGFLLYCNSFGNALFWDDDDFITKNRYIKDWKYFPKYFSENVIAGNYLLGNYWRPVLLMLFSVEWKLWQAWPPGYHIVSTLFHSVDSVLLFLFLNLLLKNRWVSFLTSLVFLAHPIQTEAVVYANAISDSLACFFIFLALIFYTKFRLAYHPQKRKMYFVGAVLCYPLGLMSKETAFMLPAYLFITDFFLGHPLPFRKKLTSGFRINKGTIAETVLPPHSSIAEKDGRSIMNAEVSKSLTALIPFFLIAGIYLWLRTTHLNFINTFNFYNEENVLTSSFWVRLLTFFRVLTVYFRLLFFPFDLHVERSVPLELSPFSLGVLGGALIAFGMLLGAYKYFRSAPIVAFGVAWFLIGIFPSSNLIIPINALLYEHFLYAPMIGIFLIVIQKGFEFAQKQEVQQKALAVMLIYLVYFSVVTVDRNRDWRDPVLFYEDLLTHAPNSYRVINNLGMMYAERKFFQKAEETYLKAIALDPTNPVGHHNIAGTYRDTGRLEAAEKSFLRALQLNPKFIFSHRSLARLYLDLKKYPQARAILEQYLLYTDDKAGTLSLLAQIAMDMQDGQGAVHYLEMALRLDPGNSGLQDDLRKVREHFSFHSPRR